MNLPKGLIIDYHEIPVDDTVVELVTQYGYEREHIVQSIVNNRQNLISTLYYLLLKKMIRNDNHISAADMNSPFFKPRPLTRAANKKTEEQVNHAPKESTAVNRSASPDINL